MRTIQNLSFTLIISLIVVPLLAQKTGLESIRIHDLKTHMLFLASDELEGRNTGEPGMNIAARYLAVQAEQLGLKPADPENGFFQPYIIQEKDIDREKSNTTITIPGMDPIVNKDPFYIRPLAQGNKTVVEGEVVFAGYGIKDEEHNYNDFENIDIEGKVVLIMNRAPMNETGSEIQFDNYKWNGIGGTQYKLPYILSQHPKAVLMVYDPKSGVQSIGETDPRIRDFLGKSRGLKREESEQSMSEDRPRLVFIHRSVADQLLEGAGKSLKELQVEIDRTLTPRSFQLDGIHIRIELNLKTTELNVSNVFGLIEGSDPVLKNEVVIYMAHFDHVGTDGKGGVFNGADDNASGTVALLEIAEAYMKEKKRPRRSVGILWVSAEEIGLFGSAFFADHPLVPLENIVAAINLDMVGRTKTKEDEESARQGLTIMGDDTVKVIGGLQSKVLMKINKRSLKEMGLVGNYAYNDPNHSDNYFYRSDHINFARKDIPVLYYSTGTHRDYHRITDEEGLIDYDKFLKMTRFGYIVGFDVAQHNDPIKVDNPMSSW